MTPVWSSPHNTRIATALLDALVAGGEPGARLRALHAAGADEETLRDPRGWITEASLRAMFRAARADRALGRRVGEALVTPVVLGLALRVGAVGAVVKAYRRFDQLAARESEDARYDVTDLTGERAQIHFSPAVGSGAPEDAWCGMREGMLAQVPTLFGLPPARVYESACTRLGAPRCTFEVRWRSARTTGLRGGAALGLALGGGLAWALGTGLAPGAVVLAAVGALGVVAGRSLDLAAELHAQDLLRRARYAVRAQAERQLSEKIDELAKLDGVLADAQARRRGQLPALDESVVGLRGEVLETLERLEAPLAALEGELERVRERLTPTNQSGGERVAGPGPASVSATSVSADRVAPVDAALEAAHRLRDGLAELEHGVGAGVPAAPRALGPLLGRSLARLRRELGPASAPTLALHVEPDLPPVRCRAADVERIVGGLVRAGLLPGDDVRRIDVTLAAAPDGVQLAVESDGPGLEPEVVDQVFDPFFAGSSAPAHGGADDGREAAGRVDVADGADPAGLGAVWAAVEAHGGQLRIETDPERGLRATVVFPSAA